MWWLLLFGGLIAAAALRFRAIRFRIQFRAPDPHFSLCVCVYVGAARPGWSGRADGLV